MALSKSDLAHRSSNMKAKLAALEKEAFEDPLKRNRKLHEQIAESKKKLSGYCTGARKPVSFSLNLCPRLQWNTLLPSFDIIIVNPFSFRHFGHAASLSRTISQTHPQIDFFLWVSVRRNQA